MALTFRLSNTLVLYGVAKGGALPGNYPSS